MRYKYIAIEGAIGAGKTTLAKQLAKRLDAGLILEEFENNPFLRNFYADPQRYALPLELYFLAERYKQLTTKNPGMLELFSEYNVSDYFLEKSMVFARNNLSAHELSLFMRLYEIMFRQVTRPDILIYLWVPVEQLLRQIQKRGRSFEQEITADYLDNIQKIYLEHLKKMKDQRIILLNYGTIDFTDDSAHIDTILNAIDQDFNPGLTPIQL